MDACSAALAVEGVVVAHSEIPMQKGHAEALAPMVRELMEQSGCAFDQLTRIAVTVGPGSFTGVRIALSFARGLGLALKVPVIGFTSLEAMALRAASARRPLPIFVTIDARRDEAYGQLFDQDARATSVPAIRPIREWINLLSAVPHRLIGSGSILVQRPGDIIELPPFPDTAVLAVAAETRLAPDYPPTPLYLRTSDAQPRLQLSEGVRLITIDPAHSSVLASLHAACFPESWDEASFVALLANPSNYGLIAVDAEKLPLGFLLAAKAADEAEILTLAVHPAHRRRGLAKLLLSRFSEEAGSVGVKRVFLDVAEDNIVARNLYTTAGFSLSGRRKAYYSDGQDAMIMARAC